MSPDERIGEKIDHGNGFHEDEGGYSRVGQGRKYPNIGSPESGGGIFNENALLRRSLQEYEGVGWGQERKDQAGRSVPGSEVDDLVREAVA